MPGTGSMGNTEYPSAPTIDLFAQAGHRPLPMVYRGTVAFSTTSRPAFKAQAAGGTKRCSRSYALSDEQPVAPNLWHRPKGACRNGPERRALVRALLGEREGCRRRSATAALQREGRPSAEMSHSLANPTPAWQKALPFMAVRQNAAPESWRRR